MKTKNNGVSCSIYCRDRTVGDIGQDRIGYKGTLFLLKRLLNHVVILGLVAVVLSCEGGGKRSFYHWKSEYRPTEAERKYLASLGVRKQYVRYFDVDWDGAPIPVGELRWGEAPDVEELVPCVFITNRCMGQVGEAEVEALAARIYEKIREISGEAVWAKVEEVQLDCDWTDGTRAIYFRLLQSLGNRLRGEGRRISATIRLDQYRYPDLRGVPPVDRGMLMCYNTGDVGEWAEENSILDVGLVSAYFSGGVRYQIPLDVALPVFRWVLVYRDNRLVRLMQGIGEANLVDEARFERTGTGRYVVRAGTYLEGVYLYEGDRLRVEGVRFEELEALAGIMRRGLGTGMTVSLYHLEEGVTGRYRKEQLGRVYKQLGL
jgi:hypothetical protein